MKILVLIGLLISSCASFAEPGDVNKTTLETGVELSVEEIKYSRIFPHAYYDQAMSSIPDVYPGSQVISKRRFFQLGKGESATFNSIVCYKKVAVEERVTISGISTYKTRAWRFEVEVDEALFTDTLIIVMEAISRLNSQ